jgi:hypothetical protein
VNLTDILTRSNSWGNAELKALPHFSFLLTIKISLRGNRAQKVPEMSVDGVEPSI